MSQIVAFLQNPIIERTGWTLVQFLWQGMVAAIALRTALLALARRPPATRYAAACVTLLAMALAPPVTFLCLGGLGSSATDPPPVAVTVESRPAPTDDDSSARADSSGLGIYHLTARCAREARTRVADLIRPWLPLSVATWLLGVTALSGILAVGILRVDRYRRNASEVRDGRRKEALSALRVRLRLSRPVLLLESAWVEVPSVVGWLRPAILLPAAALTGLSCEQLELVLAHELAHIRRHDYPINFLQGIAETVLFYHPAVWWVSRVIRVEREMCCDDIAIETCGDRVLYARALTALEELRVERRRSAVAADGGSLLDRIRRLVGASEEEGTHRSTVGISTAFLLLLIAVGVCSSLGSASAVVTDLAATATNLGSMRGQVQDEAGRPIADATVSLLHFRSPGAPGEPAPRSLATVSVVTDAAGRWTLSGLPRRALGSVVLAVLHKRFLRGEFISSSDLPLQDLEAWASVLKLRAGLRLDGLVKNLQGRPVQSATIRLGRVEGQLRDVATTDAAGRFLVESAEEGSSVIVVQAAGYAPWIEGLVLPSSNGTLDVQLEAPRTIRGSIVDAEGKPIAGARVCADRWRGQNMLSLVDLSTGADGRFTWLEAPEDVVHFDVWKEGFLSVRKHGLIASESDHPIVLLPSLRLSGAVLEARTLKPISDGSVQVGVDRNDGSSYWLEYSTASFHGGTFETAIDMPLNRGLWPTSRGYVLRALAQGYRPSVSRPFLETEGEQRFDLLLYPLSSLEWSGVVRSAEGEPVAGARVILCDAPQGLSLDAVAPGAEDTTTGPDGRFRLSPRAESRGVVVVHEKGWGTSSAETLASEAGISLDAWGRVEGKLLVRGAPAAGERIELLAQFQGYRPALACVETMSARTDAAGGFNFDRVPRGRWTLSRSIDRGTGRRLIGERQLLVVQSDQAAHVALDGTCVAIEGRLALPRQLDGCVRLCDASVSIRRKRRAPGSENEKDGLTFSAPAVDSDGSFVCEGLPLGDYRLCCEVKEPRTTHEPRIRETLARAERELVIGNEDLNGGTAISIGVVELQPTHPLRLGEAAPAFEGKTTSGETTRLENFRGKFLLLHFWASWCGPCREQAQHLRRVSEAFGRDPRLALLGVNLDSLSETAAEAARLEGMSWKHVAAGEWSKAAIVKEYRIDGIPSVFLLGPRGELVRKGLYGEEIYWATVQALGGDLGKGRSQ